MALRPGSSLPVPATPPRLSLARDYDHGTVAARVRSGTWARVGRGAYVPVTPALPSDGRALARVAAVHERLRAPHWFSHESAALIWGLPLWRPARLVHVRQPGCRPGGQRDRAVLRHRGAVDERHLTVVGRLPVTDLTQTMVDCARSLSPLAGLVVADAALRAGADRAAALGMLQEIAGRNGVARAKAVVELADEGAESPGETAARFVVLREGLPRPQTQIAVTTRLGTFWADAGWREWLLLLEYDGRVKYAGPDDLFREKRREDAIREQRYRMLRVTVDDLRAPASLGRRVRSLLPREVPITPRPLLRS